MAWRELKPISGRGQEAAISITTGGKLMWSRIVADAMGEATHIIILHDQTGQRLGIMPATEGSGLKVQANGRSVAAKSTLIAGGVWDKLELPIVGRPALYDPDSNIWAISIAPELPVKRRRRAVEEAGPDPDPDDGEYPVRGTVKGLGRSTIDE